MVGLLDQSDPLDNGPPQAVVQLGRMLLPFRLYLHNG